MNDLIKTLQAGDLQVPDVVFGYIGCSVEKAMNAISDLSDISISHDNCPHQCILCGKKNAVEIAFERLTEKRVLCKILPFQSGFHSPLFSEHLGSIKKRLDGLRFEKADTPLWSATTFELYTHFVT